MRLGQGNYNDNGSCKFRKVINKANLTRCDMNGADFPWNREAKVKMGNGAG